MKPGALTLFDRNVFETFVSPSEVVEVRIPRVFGKARAWGNEFARGTVAGYFDNFEVFSNAVREADKAAHGGIYFTLQVIDTRLLARACNRLKAGGLTTADNNCLFYRWLPIDVDPVRPSGISSSKSELDEALRVRDLISAWITESLDFPAPVRAMSGNGGHLLYRLPNIPVDDKSKAFIKATLERLAQLFNTSEVNIDTTVFNPGRIWKAYGTTAKKGDELTGNQHRPERPHRTAYIEDLGDQG